MNCYTTYRGHKASDATIYTLDIESSSFFFDSQGNLHGSSDYQLFEGEEISLHACLYIWMIGIDDNIYYGRTKEELISFLTTIARFDDREKIFWIHNFQFEFEFLKDILDFSDIFARNSHRPITARSEKYRITFRCSYMTSGVRLEILPEMYDFDINKKTGDLDYDLIRTPETPLTETELGYCEADCLVLYNYIQSEVVMYGTQENIPLTVTGKVRRKLHELVDDDYKYRLDMASRCDTDPVVYNRLVQAFAGGYVNSNFTYTGEYLADVTSYDICSSYPSVLVTESFPASAFKKVRKVDPYNLLDGFAYLLHVKITDMHSRYDNNFFSFARTLRTRGVVLDNGRVRRCQELEAVVTEVDLKLLLAMYGSGKAGKDPLKVEVIEAYSAIKKRLPKKLIHFILDMYGKKTQYKGVPEKWKEYQLIKCQFNSIFGMCITNDIRDSVSYINGAWKTAQIDNSEIVDRLKEKKRKGFLPFSAGVWCSAYARYNLLMNVMKNDEYVVYCDTDSMKLLPGYNSQNVEDFNRHIIDKIEASSKYYDIPLEMYAPADIHGVTHPIGTFEKDGVYSEFITQGAKKYASRENGELSITLSGVPKEGVRCLNNDIRNFQDGLVFDPETTGKLIHFYLDDMDECDVTDYMGNICHITDRTGICLMPTTYILGQTEEYAEFCSSERARYDESEY